jgi:hypothetical protein
MFESKINRGRANGYAPLDGSGKVPLDKLPPIQSTIDTGSFATTGSNTFTGIQTLAGTSGTSWAELNIGQDVLFGNNTYDIRATGSSGAAMALTSDLQSFVGVVDGQFGPTANFSAMINSKFGYPYSDGPVTLVGLQKSGSDARTWVYNYDGQSAFPGDITIGYSAIGNPTTSGSLNITKGNINVSGSINTTGSLNILTGSVNIKNGNINVTKGNINVSGSINISSSLVVSSTVVNNGTIGALNSDLIIDGGDIILSGSFAQQVDYAPSGSGVWSSPSEDMSRLDITKDIHLIDISGEESPISWFLPDGLYDGQVARFALKGDGTTNNPNIVKVWMNNLRNYDGETQSNTNWSPFYCGEGQGPCRSLATAVYIDGAWNIDTDWWDM